MDTDALFEQAMAAIKADRHELARQLLMQVVRANPRHEQAWLWLAGVVEELDQAIDCLHNVLVLNPNNTQAKEWLDFALKEKEREKQADRTSDAEIHIMEPGDLERVVPRLGTYLLNHGLVTPEQLKRALLAQREAAKRGKTKRLGEILVEQKAITPERLDQVLREQNKDFFSRFRD
jgi:tetratricopeptide (TPR) repeat protein